MSFSHVHHNISSKRSLLITSRIAKHMNSQKLISTLFVAGCLLLVGTLLSPADSVAQVPGMINHQGVVTVDGRRFNGTGIFRFALMNKATGKNLWTNDGSNVPGPGQPLKGVSLLVSDGIYSVNLGDTSLTNMTSISASVFDVTTVVLRIWFDDGVHGSQQLTPDQPMTTVPYAFRVDNPIPRGVIVMWSGSVATIPTGWALCDGTNGTPDLRGSFIVGYDPADTDYNVIGSRGGEKRHVLSKSEMPVHNHTASVSSVAPTNNVNWPSADGEHHHKLDNTYRDKSLAQGWDIGAGNNPGGATGWRVNVASTESGHKHNFTVTEAPHSHTVTIASEGGGSAHENRPPYYVLCFIMKL